MLTLIFARHERYEYKYDLEADVHRELLTDEGREGTTFLVEAFKRADLKPDVVNASKAPRAIESATLTHEKAGWTCELKTHHEDISEGAGARFLEEIASEKFPAEDLTILNTTHLDVIGDIGEAMGRKNFFLDNGEAVVIHFRSREDLENRRGRIEFLKKPDEHEQRRPSFWG